MPVHSSLAFLTYATSAHTSSSTFQAARLLETGINCRLGNECTVLVNYIMSTTPLFIVGAGKIPCAAGAAVHVSVNAFNAFGILSHNEIRNFPHLSQERWHRH